MNNPLVSIITPCYNGEKFIHRFLESVLKQTYNNIEFIFVNDGSTDKTEEIVLSYKDIFLEKGIDLIYIYQNNAGQAAAINKALKIFKGEYLTWPDSDDILHPNNIKNKVDFLESNPKFGLVLCKTKMVDEMDITKQIGILQRRPNMKKDNLFYDLIIEKNVYFAPGGYMVRSSAFIETNPNKYIYESRAGQNWQMLLPITYKHRCGYINEYLYDYVVRSESHSRMGVTQEDLIRKTYDHEDILLTVIKEMKIREGQHYIDIVREKYIRKRLQIAYKFRNKEYLQKQYKLLKDRGKINFRDRLVYMRGRSRFLEILYKIGLLLYSKSKILIRR